MGSENWRRESGGLRLNRCLYEGIIYIGGLVGLQFQNGDKYSHKTVLIFFSGWCNVQHAYTKSKNSRFQVTVHVKMFLLKYLLIYSMVQ